MWNGAFDGEELSWPMRKDIGTDLSRRWLGWKIGVGVIASFPAREVIISTLGTIYSLGSEVDEQMAGFKKGSGHLHGPMVGLSLTW